MNDWKERYHAAHKEWFIKKYPLAYKDGFYTPPKMPKYKTANGLIQVVCNYVNWQNGIGNRINVMGRKLGDKWIKSTTQRGTADISAMLPNGITVYFEVKIGNDKPTAEQLDMQKRVRAINGVYEFIKTPEDFFYIYDKVMNNL